MKIVENSQIVYQSQTLLVSLREQMVSGQFINRDTNSGAHPQARLMVCQIVVPLEHRDVVAVHLFEIL